MLSPPFAPHDYASWSITMQKQALSEREAGADRHGLEHICRILFWDVAYKILDRCREDLHVFEDLSQELNVVQRMAADLVDH
jgi:hypothetical protein